ncbi:HNH endonuclease [Photobacterium frigidiphilum]|uniref:HNH endonuclease n=1 Tax=Photobacterium frigidiphilum TaxID=264736 RepID=UPI003D129689
MVTVYKKGNSTIWIPVAEPSVGILPRAFLPINGLGAKYKHGYKAEIQEDNYFEALTSVQKAFIDNDSEVFLVNSGKTPERQYKFKWRHKGSLVGPTLGWAEIDYDKLTTISSEQIAEKVIQSGTNIARRRMKTIEPVLASSWEDLDSKVDVLIELIGNAIPEGQNVPKKTVSSNDQFLRDAAVVAYILKQASGKCECCDSLSPFTKQNGDPYLEVHHVKHLSDEGSDTTTNAVAVCPNCHRELHHGVNRNALVELIYGKVSRLARE